MSDFETVTFFSYLVAFGAGIISFLSPCVLPIVPGYISIVTGLSAAELREGGRKHTLAISRDTGMFVGGFTAVFVLLGLSASSVGNFLFDNQVVLARLSGALMVLMALFMVGSIFLKAPWLYQEARFHPQLGKFGRGLRHRRSRVRIRLDTVHRAGVGFDPRVAASSGRATQGATLLFAYSMGLGVPFLATGLAFGKLTGAFAWVKRHFTYIVIGSAVLLGAFGVVLMLNRLPWLTAELTRLMDAVGLDRLIELG